MLRGTPRGWAGWASRPDRPEGDAAGAARRRVLVAAGAGFAVVWGDFAFDWLRRAPVFDRFGAGEAAARRRGAGLLAVDLACGASASGAALARAGRLSLRR